MIKYKKILTLLLITTLSAINAFSQGTDVPCSDGNGDPDATPVGGCYVPIDTWVYFLVLAAVVFGAYQLHKKNLNSATLV